MNVKKLWSPAATSNNIDQFKNQLGKNKNISSYNDLHKWSVSNKEEFWDNVWDFTKILGDKKGDIFKEAKNFIESIFFNDSSLNYAENCLQEKNNHEAIIFYNEQKQNKRISWDQLRNCLLYTSPSPRDLSTSRMPSSA